MTTQSQNEKIRKMLDFIHSIHLTDRLDREEETQTLQKYMTFYASLLLSPEREKIRRTVEISRQRYQTFFDQFGCSELGAKIMNRLEAIADGKAENFALTDMSEASKRAAIDHRLKVVDELLSAVFPSGIGQDKSVKESVADYALEAVTYKYLGAPGWDAVMQERQALEMELGQHGKMSGKELLHKIDQLVGFDPGRPKSPGRGG